MLNAQNFAEAIRQGVARSGLASGRGITEAGYVSLAGTILEYLKANLEITVPAQALSKPDPEAGEVRCHVR